MHYEIGKLVPRKAFVEEVNRCFGNTRYIAIARCLHMQRILALYISRILGCVLLETMTWWTPLSHPTSLNKNGKFDNSPRRHLGMPLNYVYENIAKKPNSLQSLRPAMGSIFSTRPRFINSCIKLTLHSFEVDFAIYVAPIDLLSLPQGFSHVVNHCCYHVEGFIELHLTKGDATSMTWIVLPMSTCSRTLPCQRGAETCDMLSHVASMGAFPSILIMLCAKARRTFDILNETPMIPPSC